ncbi:MAG: helix-turn-helix domain-containing protein [Gammaproteobacteria bacterium]
MHKAPQPELSPREQLIALHQMGFTEEAIAHGLQVSQSTVSRLLSGKFSPRYLVGKKINQIFLEYYTHNR